MPMANHSERVRKVTQHRRMPSTAMVAKSATKKVGSMNCSITLPSSSNPAKGGGRVGDAAGWLKKMQKGEEKRAADGRFDWAAGTHPQTEDDAAKQPLSKE